MMLTVVERLALLQALPESGSLATLRIVRRLREELSFDESEHEILDIQEVDGRIQWNDPDQLEKDVEIGAQAMAIIVNALVELDRQENLRVEHLSLFDKFEIEVEK